MSDDAPPQVTVPPAHLWAGQGQHLLFLAALFVPLMLWVREEPALLGLPQVDPWGMTLDRWFALALAVPVVHQLLVVVGWRLQLRFRLLTRIAKSRDLVLWGALFLPLLLLRPITLAALAWVDRGSLGLPEPLTIALALALAAPSLYTLHSVKTHFGIPRALGGDHFYERYRTMPFVKRGAFRWTDNAMYGVGFLGLWAIALAGNSALALLVALVQHALIWVHWNCTEKPDIDLLYGGGSDAV